MISFLRSCPPTLLAGTLLVIINFPVGWIGLAWSVHLAKKTSNRFFYYLGVCFYVLSWGMLLLGVFLCGKDYAEAVYLKYQIPILVATLLTIISIVVFNIYFAKKPSKINEKAV